MANKILSLFFLVVAIQAALFIFDAKPAPVDNSLTFNQSGGFLNETITTNQNALFELFYNPNKWDQLSIFQLIGLLSLTVAGAGIFAGTFFFKSDLLVFASVISIFISWMSPLAQIALLLQRDNYFGDATGIVSSIVAFPFFLMAVYHSLAWWRGNSEL